MQEIPSSIPKRRKKPQPDQKDGKLIDSIGRFIFLTVELVTSAVQRFWSILVFALFIIFYGSEVG